jgi:hypothetical protein
VKLGALDAVPPALRYRIKDVLGLLPASGQPLEGVALERMSRLTDDGEPWLGADPSLADLGYWMIGAKHSVEMRRRGCIWLTMFPSVTTVERLAALATDSTTTAPVREQAIWSLGYRQARALHPATRWPSEAVQLADDTLMRLAGAATTAGKIASEELPLAMRHVQWEGA